MCVFIFGLSGLVFCGAEEKGTQYLQKGIEDFKQSDFQGALIRFREILADPAEEKLFGDAYFWIAKSSLALSRFEDASKNLEHFLKNYPGNSFYSEGLYEKGRLLYLQGEYESSIVLLQRFIDSYPNSPYTANAYYWAGESLFSLGHLGTAEKMFRFVIKQYPTSYRVEAAKYKLSLIELKAKEEELLKLLQWSHEEHLKALEEFQKRESVYEEAIDAYQRKISLLTSKDFQGEVLRLSEKVRVLEAELTQARLTESALRTEKSTLENILGRLRSDSVAPVGISAGPAAAVDAATLKAEELENRAAAVKLKEEALALKEEYLKKLKQEMENPTEGK